MSIPYPTSNSPPIINNKLTSLTRGNKRQQHQQTDSIIGNIGLANTIIGNRGQKHQQTDGVISNHSLPNNVHFRDYSPNSNSGSSSSTVYRVDHSTNAILPWNAHYTKDVGGGGGEGGAVGGGARGGGGGARGGGEGV